MLYERVMRKGGRKNGRKRVIQNGTRRHGVIQNGTRKKGEAASEQGEGRAGVRAG